MTDGSVARPLDFRKGQREQTAEMTSATVCDEASHGRSVEEHFEHRYQESRAVFEKDRASQAAVELRRNRQSLEAALEPLRLLQGAKVASETTDDDTSETLPASEDEVPSASHRRWDSRDVEWREFCLARLQVEGRETAKFLPMLSETRHRKVVDRREIPLRECSEKGHRRRGKHTNKDAEE